MILKDKCSDSYVAYDQIAAPNAGTNYPKGKPDTDEDALHQAPRIALTGTPKDLSGKEDKTAAKRAIAKQCGHPPALQDNEPHSNSGCGNSATDPC